MTQVTDYHCKKHDDALGYERRDTDYFNEYGKKGQIDREGQPINQIKAKILPEVVSPCSKDQEFIEEVRLGDSNDIADREDNRVMHLFLEEAI